MRPVRVSFASVIASDMETLSGFYSGLFDLPEVESLRSPLFRGVQAGEVVVGFSHPDAAGLLELPTGKNGPGQQFLTFEVDSAEAVEELTGRAVQAGGSLVKPPHSTYYGARQSVVMDPEGNLFRINFLDIEKAG